jgi:hypothetical protein
MSIISLNTVSVEETNLKDEFLAIADKYINRIMTKDMISQMESDYDNLFYKYNIVDFRWKLIPIENEIFFSPIRKVDDYILKGILA